MSSAADDWLEASDVIPMFPTLVWKIQLQPALRDAIEARILALLDSDRRGPLGTGLGWQSEQTLHRREELRELVVCIDKAAAGILRFMRIGDAVLELTGCWANVLAPGAVHRMHSHPNNFLSGSYYVRTGAGMNSINFHDPRAQTGIIRPPVTALTAENTDQVVVSVANGTLLLFPSYLQHSVDANAGVGERVSISFNLMFSSFTEKLAKPLW